MIGTSTTSPLKAALRPIQVFLRLEAASGILLLLCAAVALAWANLHAASYQSVFGHAVTIGARGREAHLTLHEIINDGLMSIFFLLVGMEIKRELAIGELRTIPQASLPAIAAIGGMVLPAGIFAFVNWGQPGQTGWGIPMATDIAFSIGVLTLLKDRVPRSLLVFVTALAIFDDIGGILVIALFYGGGVTWWWLAAAGGMIALLFTLNRVFVTNGVPYVLLGTGLWFALHNGGVHATIAGVMVGLMIPARSADGALQDETDRERPLTATPVGEEVSAGEVEESLGNGAAPLTGFVRMLHPFVAFFVMPTFALANAGVVFRGFGASILVTPVALGASLALLVGKAVGIFGCTMLAIRLGLAPMPRQVSTAKLIGASVIAGIGFTVALFIATLAFPTAPHLLDQAKAGVLLGSATAGVLGFLILRMTPPVAKTN